jgi:hypothetical protein
MDICLENEPLLAFEIHTESFPERSPLLEAILTGSYPCAFEDGFFAVKIVLLLFI